MDIFAYFDRCIEQAGYGEDAMIPGLELMKLFNVKAANPLISSNKNNESFNVFSEGFEFQVFRITYPKEKAIEFTLNLDIIKNEIGIEDETPVGGQMYVLDYVFWGNRLICIVPVLEQRVGKRSAQPRYSASQYHYYDFAHIWMDVGKVCRQSVGFEDEISDAYRLEEAIDVYVDHLYGEYASELQPVGEMKFIDEYLRDGLYYYKIYNLDQFVAELKQRAGQPKPSTETFYISLPSAYTPGKYIDIEYYNAIYEEFDLKSDDSVFVIGYGAGIDLIHSARCCDSVYGVEINPFSVVSARMNVRLSLVSADIVLEWGDVREWVKSQNRKGVPQADGSVLKADRVVPIFNRVIWNMPYESRSEKNTPIKLSEFYDNYSAIDILLKVINDPTIVSDKLGVLLWNIHTDELIKEKSIAGGFDYFSDNTKNICILRRTSEPL
ncbi:MAG: hypothetical protein LBV33_02080 [Lachnospiraceae bacterium]|nr:hypothetical protein [Lachnospiraceae bacterium]